MKKLNDRFPRVKVAIIKRAYWKNPPKGNCFCSNPESAWAAVAAPVLQSAEDLLRYLHESNEISNHIEPENENSDSPKRTRFYAKVDIEVVAALMSTVVENRNKLPIDQVRIAMLKAASKRMQEIKFCSSKLPPHPKILGITWFSANDFVDQAAVAAQTTAAGGATSCETKAKVAVLEFDEKQESY